MPFGKSSDSNGKPRFIPTPVRDLFDPLSNVCHFFKKESAYKFGEGFDCCSDELIALHYVTAEEIRRFHQIILAHPLERKDIGLFFNETVSECSLHTKK